MINYINVLHDLKLTVGDDMDHGWHELPCPTCRVPLDPYWFAEMIESQAAFVRVSPMVIMPCCQSNLSVNAVCEHEKRRLTGFVLSFRSLGREMDVKVIRQLEQVLDCPLHMYFDMEHGGEIE